MGNILQQQMCHEGQIMMRKIYHDGKDSLTTRKILLLKICYDGQDPFTKFKSLLLIDKLALDSREYLSKLNDIIL